MQRARALLSSLRPIGWIPFLFSLVLGLADAGFVSLREVALSLIIFGPLLSGGIYVVNFYSDIEIDRRSSVVKDLPMWEQPFATGALGAKRALIMAALLLLRSSWSRKK